MKIKLAPEKPKRLLILFGLFLLILAGEWLSRRWFPTHHQESAHFAIASAAQPEQTREVAAMVEIIYSAYTNTLAALPDLQRQHPKLKLKLYRDQRQFKRVNRWQVRWAEAFYEEPYCHAYYSAAEVNPFHWMTHEVVHQLNREVAGLRLAQWADEGVACYFSSCQIAKGVFVADKADPNTYPAWWLPDMRLSGNLEQDLAAGNVIPLRAIITGQDGPSVDKNVNLYYLHWWSIAQFLMLHDDGKYKSGLVRVLREGGSLESFERHIGKVEPIQQEWYAYLLAMRKAAREPAASRPTK